ncbi:MAG: hypothetical protein ACREOW_12435 [Thermodesulfobacteriota bacterium]
MILSDHGHEPTKGSIDITKNLKTQDISTYDYTNYIEVAKSRFWFNSDRARERILDMLSPTEHSTLLSYKDLHKYNVRFKDDSYGEFYFIADPDFILFPNDFYHPLGNLFLGVRSWQERRRLLSPKYRGHHPYLQHNES